MDWPLVIDRNRTALLTIIVALMASLGLVSGGRLSTLPLFLYRRALLIQPGFVLGDFQIPPAEVDLAVLRRRVVDHLLQGVAERGDVRLPLGDLLRFQSGWQPSTMCIRERRF